MFTKSKNFKSIYFLVRNYFFAYNFLIFPFLLVVIVLFFTISRVSGSSIGEYNEYLQGPNYKDPGLLFGQARSIRSDEWLVETPFTLSQRNNNFEVFNNRIGLGQDMTLIGDAPTKHWSVLFQPQNWAYLVLPLENAFAFEWWIRGFILILGTYLFLLRLTKNDFLLSSTGSLMMFFTPFVQWWYSTTAVELIAYLFFILYFYLKIFDSRKINYLFFYTLGLTYFGVSFILILYPPFFIPLALLIITFSVGYLIDIRKQVRREKLKFIVPSLVFTTVITIFLTIFYYLSEKNLIDIIRHTSYPGSRETFGGGYTFTQFFSGYYDFLFQRNREAPIVLGNASEGSNGILLFPFLIPLLSFLFIRSFIKKLKLDFVLLFLLSFAFFLTTWMVLGLPEIFSKITLLTTSTPARSIIAIIILNMIVVFYFISRVKIDDTLSYKISAFITAVFATLVVFSFGFYLKNTYPNFNSHVIFVIAPSIGIFLVTITLLLKAKKLFVLFFLGYLFVSTFMINPLYIGLNPLWGSELSNAILRIDRSDNKTHRWVTYDSVILPSYLIGVGVNSLNGVHLYPQADLWKRIDPNEKQKTIWNRYAHIQFKENLDDKVAFQLNQADFFTVKINPCNKLLADLDVKHFVFTKKVSYSCMAKEQKIKLKSQIIYIYSRGS